MIEIQPIIDDLEAKGFTVIHGEFSLPTTTVAENSPSTIYLSYNAVISQSENLNLTSADELGNDLFFTLNVTIDAGMLSYPNIWIDVYKVLQAHEPSNSVKPYIRKLTFVKGAFTVNNRRYISENIWGLSFNRYLA